MGRTVKVSGFPPRISAQTIKAFLEKRTGEGTVFAIKVRPFKSGASRTYAIVQFTSDRDALRIITLASRSLWYESSYIEAQEVTNDIVPKPRVFKHSLEHVTLYLGCQISSKKLYVLWKGIDVLVNFGTEMRKLHFLFSDRLVYYKLELSYENVWQTELRNPHGESAKYLLIQLAGAPRIFEKEVHTSGSVYDDPVFNYYKEAPDELWIRTTDFTPSCCIGQSSTLCIKLPSSSQLHDLQENFGYFKENRGKFTLENGNSFSCNPSFVPIIRPPSGVILPYEIIFKINVLVQKGCIPGPALDTTFYRLVDPRRFTVTFIEHALQKLFHLKECCYDPSKWLEEQYQMYIKHPPRSPAISLAAGLVYVRRVQVTPCKVYFYGPEINLSNRVLRYYSQDINNFLRVSFVDEEFGKLSSTDLSPHTASHNEGKRTKIYCRILSIITNGLVIGDKKFEFLAFSSSQLRDNSLWMFASRTGCTVDDIRRFMGNFSGIRNVAKYAARLGQSFSSSIETLSVSRNEMEVIPDVEIHYGETKYCFSDGIGKISATFAGKVAKKCGFKGGTPSAFQIRYGGNKGVVAVDPNSSMKLSLRKSMFKYESSNEGLDVLAYSKYRPYYLNRQLITLLSTLGVGDNIFLKKQRQAVEQLNSILTDPLKAQEALELMYPGETAEILKAMLMCCYKPDVEPFLSMMLQAFRASKLLELRIKSRIFILEGRLMMGCLDETRTLEYGQVFLQCSCSGYRPSYGGLVKSSSSRLNSRFIVKGKVVVAKNPCLHPGDVRVLTAVDVPALHHMVDCVVFPQKGSRPHPNECSGSDLDGDIYAVCWDNELIPPQQIEPMDYTSAPPIQLDHDVTVEDVQKYFVDYFVNENLGMIATAHIILADTHPQKAMSPECLKLAMLHSIAVDFSKTGIPAIMSPHLRPNKYPDFMEKPNKATYVSTNAIGKLFREVKDIGPDTSSIKSFTREVAMTTYDTDMEVYGFENFIGDAFTYKTNYDHKLGNLMNYYGFKTEAEILMYNYDLKTEAEILSGSIMRVSKSFMKRRNAEAITMAVRSLRKEARAWFNEKSNRSRSGSRSIDLCAKASAWYHVTYHHNFWGRYNEGLGRDHYLSFPWCVYDKLTQIKKDKASSELHVEGLAMQLR